MGGSVVVVVDGSVVVVGNLVRPAAGAARAGRQGKALRTSKGVRRGTGGAYASGQIGSA